MLAPIALYPDALLAQITTASTNPQEILDVDHWLGQNQNRSVSQLTAAAQQQGFILHSSPWWAFPRWSR